MFLLQKCNIGAGSATATIENGNWNEKPGVASNVWKLSRLIFGSFKSSGKMVLLNWIYFKLPRSTLFSGWAGVTIKFIDSKWMHRSRAARAVVRALLNWRERGPLDSEPGTRTAECRKINLLEL